MYMRPFTTSRMITVRLPPPVLPGRISGSTSPHSSSVRSLGYRNLLRSQRARFLLVHIGDPSSNQATSLESQVIHMIQELFGQTLRDFEDSEFQDQLERARRQTSGRMSLMGQLFGQAQDIVTVISFAAGLIFYAPWLIALLFLALV